MQCVGTRPEWIVGKVNTTISLLTDMPCRGNMDEASTPPPTPHPPASLLIVSPPFPFCLAFPQIATNLKIRAAKGLIFRLLKRELEVNHISHCVYSSQINLDGTDAARNGLAETVGRDVCVARIRARHVITQFVKLRLRKVQ